MAIATGTATLIAAGAGLATTGATTGMSFFQANKQQKLQKEAEAEADKAMAEARASLKINYMDALSIQKEPYELQREAMISQGAQAIDAAQESERGAAAGAGRVQMAQNEAQAGIRTAMGNELTEIERLKVAEDARLRDLNVQLDLAEVEGAQMAARNAQEMAAQATAQGFEGVTSMGTQAANMIPLYGYKKDTGFTVNALDVNGKPLPKNTFDPNAMSPISGQNSNIDYMSPASGFGFGTLPTVSAANALKQSIGSQRDPNFYNPFAYLYK
jgi:hypothetical protein